MLHHHSTQNLTQMPKIHICVTLWIILIIMMILHFNYHVGEIFYGIDVVSS